MEAGEHGITEDKWARSCWRHVGVAQRETSGRVVAGLRAGGSQDPDKHRWFFPSIMVCSGAGNEAGPALRTFCREKHTGHWCNTSVYAQNFSRMQIGLRTRNSRLCLIYIIILISCACVPIVGARLFVCLSVSVWLYVRMTVYLSVPVYLSVTAVVVLPVTSLRVNRLYRLLSLSHDKFQRQFDFKAIGFTVLIV